MKKCVFSDLRDEYHRKICGNILAEKKTKKGEKTYNIADTGNKTSIVLAGKIASKMKHPIGKKAPKSQTTGTLLGQYTMEFLEAAFAHLQHIRPSRWIFSVSQAGTGIAAYDQYEHLNGLQRLLNEQPELKATLGGDYLITPDVVVARHPLTDSEINSKESLVGDQEQVVKYAPLRGSNYKRSVAILHASISCKWTIRSDRAQNTRTEALNLIRNRKGRTPHIAAVTFEPMLSRIASIAMGTGDIDCTYHCALYELIEASNEVGNDLQIEMLNTLIEGKRLRDISDLPFDLAT